MKEPYSTPSSGKMENVWVIGAECRHYKRHLQKRKLQSTTLYVCAPQLWRSPATLEIKTGRERLHPSELFVHYLQNQNNAKIWPFPIIQSIHKESSTVCFCLFNWRGGLFSASPQGGLRKAEKGTIRPLVPRASGAKAMACPEESTLHRSPQRSAPTFSGLSERWAWTV